MKRLLLYGLFCLVLTLRCGAGQFVELTAEIEMNPWDYWFLVDEKRLNSGREEDPDSIFAARKTVRCVVGTNTWMMEGEFSVNAKHTYWFTGTNIIQHTVVTKETPNATRNKINRPGWPAISSPRVGERHTRVYESADGNPGRPVRVEDLMFTQSRIPWLAFCSGPVFKREGRQIFPPSDFWKQTITAPIGFADTTKVFEDGLGLPKSLRLFTQNSQPIFQYQVHQSTNVMGWNFPLEFYLVQYGYAGTNGWELHLTAKGKVTVIGAGTEPEIPVEVLKAAEK